MCAMYLRKNIPEMYTIQNEHGGITITHECDHPIIIYRNLYPNVGVEQDGVGLTLHVDVRFSQVG